MVAVEKDRVPKTIASDIKGNVAETLRRKGPPITWLQLKLLRRYPYAGDMTRITHGMLSPRDGTLWKVYPTFEEYFLLE